jgi:hypothetical protein
MADEQMVNQVMEAGTLFENQNGLDARYHRSRQVGLGKKNAGSQQGMQLLSARNSLLCWLNRVALALRVPWDPSPMQP